jgi:methylmalonyl-CoA mutase
MEKLFSEFKPVSAAEWKNQIVKDLKGTEFEKLVWKNPNGFDVQPFYDRENAKNAAPLFTHINWEISAEIHVVSEKEANAQALKALTGGASSLIFHLHKTSDFAVLLKDISIEHIELNFVLYFVPENFSAEFDSCMGYEASKLNCTIVFDAINQYNASGKWFSNQNTDFASWTKFASTTKHHTVAVDASSYQNAGALPYFELACALAHAHEYAVALIEKNIKYKFPFRFTIATGPDFFGEIAKLRALRKLWPLVANAYGLNPQLHLHCETSSLNIAAADAYNNLLRSTTEGMSAVLGGCNSLTVHPYNEAFENPNDFSFRMSRNQQLIFKEESYLDKVADPGAGSYYIETLTDELAHKAWEEFKTIESKGGLLVCIENGYIPSTIKKQAGQLISNFNEGKLVMVGVNKFRSQKSEVKSQKLEETGILQPLNLEDHLVKENA